MKPNSRREIAEFLSLAIVLGGAALAAFKISRFVFEGWLQGLSIPLIWIIFWTIYAVVLASFALLGMWVCRRFLVWMGVLTAEEVAAYPFSWRRMGEHIDL